MSILAHPDGTRARLQSRTILGRASTCALQVQDGRASKEHAAVWWEDGGWRVRDLGSRNGTWVDGRALEVGEVVSLGPGSTLGLGQADVLWTLVDAAPPRACAVRVRDAAEQPERGGLIALPSPGDPQVTICSTASGWSLEGPEGSRETHHGDLVEVEAEVWRLELPETLAATRESDPVVGSLEQVELHFRVSPDEEMVLVDARCGTAQWRLEARSYHYLLLTLARQRLADRSAGVPRAAEGWIGVKDLAHMLRMEERTLNVHIYRARRQLGDLGVEGSGKLIERRGRTGQLRLAVDALRVERLT